MEFLTIVRAVAAVMAALLLVVCLADAEDMNGPPSRPDIFRNPQELRNYLKALNEYFAIVGRPRYSEILIIGSRSKYTVC